MSPSDTADLNSLAKRSSLVANACGVKDAEDDRVASDANERVEEEDGCAGGSEPSMSEPSRTSLMVLNNQEYSLSEGLWLDMSLGVQCMPDCSFL